MKLYHAYTPNEDREDLATYNDEPTMTQAADANETDINVIMQRFGATNQLPNVIAPALSGDFTNVPDYRTAVELIQAADAAFLEIDPDIRLRFGNDPGKFIEFASDPKNAEELKRMGLTKDPEERTLAEQHLDQLKALNEKLTPKGAPNGTGPQ